MNPSRQAAESASPVPGPEATRAWRIHFVPSGVLPESGFTPDSGTVFSRHEDGGWRGFSIGPAPFLKTGSGGPFRQGFLEWDIGPQKLRSGWHQDPWDAAKKWNKDDTLPMPPVLEWKASLLPGTYRITVHVGHPDSATFGDGTARRHQILANGRVFVDWTQNEPGIRPFHEEIRVENGLLVLHNGPEATYWTLAAIEIERVR